LNLLFESCGLSEKVRLFPFSQTEHVTRESSGWLALDAPADLAARENFHIAIMLLGKLREHLKLAIALNQGPACPMKGLVAPLAARAPLHDPLNAIAAINEPQVTVARYDPIVVLLSLIAAGRFKNRGFGGFAE
jgi:hypothetical protein